MAVRSFGEEHRTTLVCIDSYELGVPQGRFFNPYMKSEQSFKSLTQLLQGFENTLEEMDFPKAYTVTRTFTPFKAYLTDSSQECVPGKKATFAIRILFRQNASWQGSITWVEGKQEQAFRSVLELILLMSSVLDCSKAS